MARSLRENKEGKNWQDNIEFSKRLQNHLMKVLTKMLFGVLGFAFAIIASPGFAQSSPLVAEEPARECHGSGTCFVTPGGTTINGQWTEAAR